MPILSARGALYVARGDQQGALDALLRELSASGHGVQRVSAAECLRRVPVLREAGLLGGVFEADAMDIDVHALHQGFLRGFKHQGGTLWCDAEVTQGIAAGGQWTLELADGRRVRCRTVVNAAGAWADELAKRCGALPLYVQPKRRSAFTFPAPAGVDVRAWPTVADVRGTLVLQARCRPVARLAGQRRPGARARRGARRDSTSPPASRPSRPPPR